MSKAGVFGLPAGGASLTASLLNSSASVATGSASVTVATRAPVSQDAHFIAQGLRVVNPALRRFTATIENDMGNGSHMNGRSPGSAGSFEPIMYRKRLEALRDDDNRVYADARQMDSSGLYRGGYMEGGIARVYRIEDGAMVLKRTSDIVGWSHRGWNVTPKSNKMLALSANTGLRLSFADSATGSVIWVAVWPVKTDGSWGAYQTARIDVVQRTVAAPTNPTQITRISRPETPTAINGLANLTATLESSGQVVALTWDATTDAAGYLYAFSDTDPATHPAGVVADPISLDGWYCELEDDGGAAIEIGDLVIVEKRFPNPVRSEIFFPSRNRDSKATQRWRFQPLGFYRNEQSDRNLTAIEHPANTFPTDGGRWFARLSLDADVTQTLRVSSFAGTADSFYAPVVAGRTFRAEVWVRLHSGAATVAWDGTDAGGNSTRPAVIATQPGALTSAWQRITTTFTFAATYTGSALVRVPLLITAGAAGCEIDVDGYRIYDDAAAYMDFLPEEYTILNDAGIGGLRYHNTIKSGSVGITYDLEQLTNEAGATSFTRMQGLTLPAMLRQCKNVGGSAPFDPWLQIEYYFRPDEWLGFAEYMFAPYDPETDTPAAKPWAHKRHLASGQTAPWISEFSKVLFEISNETWNPLFQPWTFTDLGMFDGERGVGAGETYGLFQEHVISILKSSPYWTSAVDAKVEFVLGGWRARNGFGEEAARFSPRSHFLMTAAYNGGWDEGDSQTSDNPEKYQGILYFPARTTRPSADDMVRIVSTINAERASISGSVTLRSGTYEAGPGYAIPGNATATEKAVQEKVRKSQAAGAATLDAWLMLAESGYEVQNFFLFGQGLNWSSHTRFEQGGQTHLPWQTIGLFSRRARGDLLNVVQAKVPRITLTGTTIETVEVDVLDPDTGDVIGTEEVEQEVADPTQTVPNVPRVTCYATQAEGHVAVMLINRNLPYSSLDEADPLYDADDDGVISVRVDLPIRSATGMTVYSWAMGYDAGNTEGGTIEPAVTTPAVPSTPGVYEDDVAPASVRVVVYSGVVG